MTGLMSLALCPQVVSQASQHFRSSKKQATCEGCFARQSVCSVVSLHSGMSVQESTPTGVFEDGCRPSTHLGLRLLWFVPCYRIFPKIVQCLFCIASAIEIGPRLYNHAYDLSPSQLMKSKHIKGSKERCLSGQKHSLQIFGVTTLSSYKTTLKQQLNGEKRCKKVMRFLFQIFFSLGCWWNALIYSATTIWSAVCVLQSSYRTEKERKKHMHSNVNISTINKQ